jgi:hypothetical protein
MVKRQLLSPSGYRNLSIQPIARQHIDWARLLEYMLYIVYILIWIDYKYSSPITVVMRSKEWTVYHRLNTGIVGSNPTRDMDICVRLFCVCVVLCVGRGLVRGWFPVQGVLPTVYKIRKLKNGQGHTKGSGVLMNEWMKWMNKYSLQLIRVIKNHMMSTGRCVCVLSYEIFVRETEKHKPQAITEIEGS